MRALPDLIAITLLALFFLKVLRSGDEIFVHRTDVVGGKQALILPHPFLQK